MHPIKQPIFLILTTLFLTQVSAGQTHDTLSTPYAGLETRAIKSLSESDIAELEKGGGWGMALVAELNGIPGPAHLLELKDRIELTEEQIERITLQLKVMKAAAIPVGQQLIRAEAELERAFQSGEINEAGLMTLLEYSEKARTELRFIHLSQHLTTPALLTQKQITRYNRLRGYGESHCSEVPAGHDPERYRQAHGCQ
ncbi:hypothetical protein [Nitrincola sp. MINF-07-Sa-05]|uniref:hypothetical protein n=1 Tax=Nitrincola salilacus TaxID=3400273 RepID=UPI0039181D03